MTLSTTLAMAFSASASCDRLPKPEDRLPKPEDRLPSPEGWLPKPEDRLNEAATRRLSRQEAPGPDI